MDFALSPAAGVDLYRYVRQARLVDGATEVHQQVLARHFMEERGDFWRWA